MPDAVKLEPEGWSRKPTIDELRAILNHEEDFAVVILPNGEIRSPSDEILDKVIALQKAQDAHDDRPETIQENPKSWIAWKREAERLQALLATRTPSTTASTEGEWRTLDDDGYKNHGNVVICTGGYIVGEAAWGEDEHWYWASGRYVSNNVWRWMPLPAPPQGADRG